MAWVVKADLWQELRQSGQKGPVWLGGHRCGEYRLSCCSQEGGGGVLGPVVEVDFFDKPDGQLVLLEEEMIRGVDARGAVFAERPLVDSQ